MKEIIYIKYGDLTLKGNNKNEFINQLIKNIKRSLKGYDVVVEKQIDCAKVFFNNASEKQDIIKILSLTPGIMYIIEAYETETDLDKISESIKKMIPQQETTFKIELKRKYDIGLDHLEIKRYVATKLLASCSNLKVDVHNPNLCIWIELRKDKSLFYFNRIQGCNGLPIGLNGSCLSLISGGIDSPVASFLVQKKGLSVDYLTFITSEVTQKTIDKIKNLINKVTLNGKIFKPKFYIVDFTKIQHELTHARDEKYRITLMRRSFYRIANQLAKSLKYDSLCCGDSLGQVASQTIESMTTINSVVNDMIVFRPLLTYDKNDIIKIAREIGTYDISITDHEDICSLFAPKNPITRPTIERAKINEKSLELLELLENSAIKNLRIIEE